MSNFYNLVVWQKSMKLIREIYMATNNFPYTEKFGLSSQMRRAAISMASNIAEGCERKTPKDFANFITCARGSAAELETQVLAANDLKFLQQIDHLKLIQDIIEIRKMLSTLHRKILNPVE